ncbi:programmed cell death protein 4 [Mantella aurantiaca]
MEVEQPREINANLLDAENLNDSLFDGDEENAAIRNEVNGNVSASTINEAKLHAKAKRRLRKNSSRDSGRGDSVSDNGETARGILPTSPKTKLMDRKSRSGKGRGLPKKGGAGGKGVWGTPGQVYDVEEVDIKDPNYDDQENCVYETTVLPLDENAFEKSVTPIVQEYFEHGDTNEVAEMLKDLNLGGMKSGLPALAVSLALEGKASHREMTSKLLHDLCGTLLSAEDLASSFDKLLQELPELVLDTPRAPQLVGQFIARAVGDGILSRSYMESYKGTVDCDHARSALTRATILLTMSRGGRRRMDSVWGSGGGQQPVKKLVKEIDMLLKEYVLSGDVLEAERCLQELEVPHFHHELVYEAVLMVLESSGDNIYKTMLPLLECLWKSGVVTLDQMKRGYDRIYYEIPDINLDAPHAYSVLERFVEDCFKAGIISKQIRDQCPSRGRKRFVSEGDGGRLKSESY